MLPARISQAPVAGQGPVSGAAKARYDRGGEAAEEAPGQAGVIVERDEVLRRRQGRQMAFTLDGAAALQLMIGTR